MRKIALIGGKVYTPYGFAEALLAEGDRIAFIGSSEDVSALAGIKVEKIHLDGRVVLPGLCDSHAHFLAWASNSEKLDLRSARSILDIRAALRKYIDRAGNNPEVWIEGRGWNQELFDDQEQRMPTRDDLDDITPNIPVILPRVCGHVAVVNSAALKAMHITGTTFIEGGVIDKDDDGEPNGIIRENALELFRSMTSTLTKDGMSQLLSKYGTKAASLGLTTINSDDLSYTGDDFNQLIEVYLKAEREGKLPFRVRQQLLLKNTELLTEFLAAGWRTGMGGRRYKIGPLKLLCDGSLGGRTAWLREEYADSHGTKGIPIYTQEALDELVWLAHSSGMQVAMHAIGDAALDLCLNAIEKSKVGRRNSLRHLIVHCQIADDAQLNRIKRLNVGVAMQPSFVPSDMDMALKRLGQERATSSYRWKTMIDKGIILSAGSDAPVETLSPIAGIHAAVTRQNENHSPYGGWVESEKLSVSEAVNLYTWASAWHSGEENIRGELVQGKLADITIIDEDIFLVAPHKIKDIKVSMTICGGEITYS